MTGSEIEQHRGRDLEYLEPYRPLSGVGVAPATGAHEPTADEVVMVEEPVATGTLFLMIVFLMLTFGIWLVVYNLLLSR